MNDSAQSTTVPHTARHVGRSANAASPRFGFMLTSHWSAGHAMTAVSRIAGDAPAAAAIMTCADRKIGRREKLSREMPYASNPLATPAVIADETTAGNGAVGSAMNTDGSG